MWTTPALQEESRVCSREMPSVVIAQAMQQMASVARGACVRSAIRPATGAESSRTAVAAPNIMPICSEDSPLASVRAGSNGEAAPNAA